MDLKYNETLERMIEIVQKEPTPQRLSQALSLIRRNKNDGAEWIVAVEQQKPGGMTLKTVQTDDGRRWFMAFTSFEEQLKGSDSVQSAFTAGIAQIFQTVRQADAVEGIILNPWNKTLMLDRTLIDVIEGKH